MHRSQGGDHEHEPDERGRFGEFGGRFVPETVMGALDELVAAWYAAQVRTRRSAASSTASAATSSAGRPRCTWPSG